MKRVKRRETDLKRSQWHYGGHERTKFRHKSFRVLARCAFRQNPARDFGGLIRLAFHNSYYPKDERWATLAAQLPLHMWL